MFLEGLLTPGGPDPLAMSTWKSSWTVDSGDGETRWSRVSGIGAGSTAAASPSSTTISATVRS